MTKVSRVQAIAAKCKDCIYDPLERGAWREQVAACTLVHCALFPVRPVPRHCTKAGQICADRVEAIRLKLSQA